jgi:hypothetical protein
MKLDWAKLLLIIVGFLALAFYAAAPLVYPLPAPVSAPADQFSAEPAMQYVRALSQAPRVIGSPEMKQAAHYVVESLHACGFDPEIQEAASPQGQLYNVVVDIPGNSPGNAILVLTHLDSVSFGAGDNATGAAVLLETACSLHASRPFQNDVILLFEDGEEIGYLGGYAFAQAYPSVSSIRRVIGLDTAAWGPVVLLQTTPINADFIQAYSRAVKHPTAWGFFADADLKISGDTSKIQPFYEKGILGLELEDPTAFTGKHSPADTIDKVHPGSLQQMGDQLLALVQYLGNSTITGTIGSSQSFFALWGIGLVHYPALWNLVLTILSAIAFVASIVKSIRNKALSGRSLLYSLGSLFLVLIGAAFLGMAGSVLFEKLFPNPNPKTGSYLVPASLPAFLLVVGIVVYSFIVIRRKLVSRLGAPPISYAGASWWLLLSIVSSVLLQVGSYVFVLPLVTVVLINILPDKLKVTHFILAAIATILIFPNITLTYLSTGLKALVLITVLLVMLTEFWAEAYRSFPNDQTRGNRLKNLTV